MKIMFVLPIYAHLPIGGFHVHYQYANRMARRGHEVSIAFPHRWDGPDTYRAKASFWHWALQLRRKHRPLVTSMALDRRVKVRLVQNLRPASLPDADILVATAWQTAEMLADAPSRCGRKFYIVYDYEHLMTAEADIASRIEATYRAGFGMISTSAIVDATIRRCGGTPLALVPCGLDFDAFGVDVPSDQRAKLSVGFPVRGEAFKGTEDAVAAMTLLRERYGSALSITGFGSRRTTLPEWVNWLEYPDHAALRAFYNAQSVFVVPSHFEGWGLPGIEAIACGSALVTTDNGGCGDYAIDGATALVVPPRTPDAIAEAVSRLFEDDALRRHLVSTGGDFVRRFTWDAAVDALEAAWSLADPPAASHIG